VHISNRIKQFAALSVGKKVNVVVRCGDELIPHPKGYCFDVICEVYSSDSNKLLWESSSIYLCRKKHKTEPSAESLYKSELAESDMQGLQDLDEAPWKLKGDLGRKYASVSEDYNPIHMFGITAALFGFPKGCIAHGLWTSARTMATLDKTGDVSSKCDASKGQFVEYYTEFKLPIFLPSSVVLMGSEENKEGSQFFQVMSAKDKTIPHMKGCLKVHKKK
jgi:acyl dehydratase